MKNVLKNKRSMIIIALLLLVILGGAYYIFMQNDEEDWLDPTARDGILKAHSRAEIQEILDREVEKGNFNVAINTEPTFANGKAEGNVWIENIPANHYYMTVKMVLKDTDEVIFETKAIKPNQFIQNAKLDKELKKGEYLATAVITITDPTTKQEIGVTNVEQKIIIEN